MYLFCITSCHAIPVERRQAAKRWTVLDQWLQNVLPCHETGRQQWFLWGLWKIWLLITAPRPLFFIQNFLKASLEMQGCRAMLIDKDKNPKVEEQAFLSSSLFLVRLLNIISSISNRAFSYDIQMQLIMLDFAVGAFKVRAGQWWDGGSLFLQDWWWRMGRSKVSCSSQLCHLSYVKALSDESSLKDGAPWNSHVTT